MSNRKVFQTVEKNAISTVKRIILSMTVIFAFGGANFNQINVIIYSVLLFLHLGEKEINHSYLIVPASPPAKPAGNNNNNESLKGDE